MLWFHVTVDVYLRKVRPWRLVFIINLCELSLCVNRPLGVSVWPSTKKCYSDWKRSTLNVSGTLWVVTIPQSGVLARIKVLTGEGKPSTRIHLSASWLRLQYDQLGSKESWQCQFRFSPSTSTDSLSWLLHLVSTSLLSSYSPVFYLKLFS